MGIAFDTKDHKTEYEKALLTEALSSTTLKTKATLLVFSSLLLIVTAYGLQLKTIPGLSLDIPDGMINPLEGMLAFACLYLIIQFVLCFFQDYFRWRLHQGIASVAHSGKVLSDLEQRVSEIEDRFNSLEPLMEQKFYENIASLLQQLDGRSKQVIGIGLSHKVLWALQAGRFWVIDLVIPVALTAVAIFSSGNAALELLQVVKHAL